MGLILIIGELWLLLETGDTMAPDQFAGNVGKVEENSEAVPGWLGEWGTEYNVHRGGEGHRHSMHTNPLSGPALCASESIRSRQRTEAETKPQGSPHTTDSFTSS